MTPDKKKRLWNSLKDAVQTLRDAIKDRNDLYGIILMPPKVFDIFFGKDAHLEPLLIYRHWLFGFEVHTRFGGGNRIDLLCWCNEKYGMICDEGGDGISYRKILMPAKCVGIQININKVLGSCPE